VGTLAEVDLICLLLEANASIGSGDRFIAEVVQQVATPKLLVLNKIDRAGKADIADHLVVAQELGDFDAYIPLSAKTGEGVDALATEIEARLSEGPHYYPSGVVTDQPETVLAAEILREKLLAVAREELPHSITVAAELIEPADDEPPAAGESDEPEVLRIRAVVRVERESQKGMVIGKGGRVLKDAGTRARQELEALLGTRVYLETRVKVERDWQRRAHALDRLGY
jgi:GTP-binding protein Era